VPARKISIAQAPKWVSELEGRMRKAALRGLLSAAHRTVGYIQNEVIPREERAPVDRGIYRAGWRARKVEGGALVYNGVPHAPMVEWGVRGENVKIGKRMIDALAEWVVRKGLVGKQPRESRAAAGRQIAWAIAKSMQKRGIFGGEGRGLRVMEKARPQIVQFIEEEVKREIEAMRE
jgi:hypothetical protein